MSFVLETLQSAISTIARDAASVVAAIALFTLFGGGHTMLFR